MKICKKCKLPKPIEDFHVGRAKCKVCREAYLTSYRDKNRQKTRANKNNWKVNNPDKVKDAALKSDYGIDLKQYNDLLSKQNNACAICKKDKAYFDKALSVDHCHKTNLIRGLLCLRCNRSLGLLFDNPELFRSAAEYLEKAYANQEKESALYSTGKTSS